MDGYSTWSGRVVDPDRVVQILASGGGDAFGTGYRIRDDLVLSAAHVVRTAAADDGEILVWTEQAKARQARIEWMAEQADVAVIRLIDADELVRVPPVAWGRVPRRAHGAAQAHLIGYPQSNQISGRRAKDERFGLITPASYGEHQLYAVDVEGPSAARPTPQLSLWAGMSGSAVFCDGLLVGVVTHDQLANEPGRLLATPIETLLQDERFCALLQISDVAALATPRPATQPGPQAEMCLCRTEGSTWKHAAMVEQRLGARGVAVRQVSDLSSNELLGWVRGARTDVPLSIAVLGSQARTGDLLARVGELAALTRSHPSVSMVVVLVDGPADIGAMYPVFGLDDVDGLSGWAHQPTSDKAGSSPVAAGSPPRLLDPYPLSTQFVGRQEERARLTEWLTSGWPPVMVVAGIGGMGKSALAWAWVMGDVLRLLPNVHQDAPTSWLGKRVFWFSFYRPDASASAFIRELLRYLRPADDWSATAIGDALVHLWRVLEQDDVLVVMDGLERELWSYARLDAPMLSDQHADRAADRSRLAASPVMGALLRGLNSPALKAKVLITTRLMPADLEGIDGQLVTTCTAINLSSFTKIDVVRLFRSLNIRGSDADIVAACEPYGYHPLTVSLLGGMIAHDVRSPLDIAVAGRRKASPRSQRRRVHILTDSFAALDERTTRVITRMSAVRIPVTFALVEHLNEDMDGDLLDELLSDLIARNLVMFDRGTQTFDLHPLVRGYSYGQLVEADHIHELIADRLGDEADDTLELLSRQPTRESFRHVQPVLVELMYQLIMAEDRESAAEIWVNNLFPTLTGLGEFDTAIKCAETLCRDDAAFREQVDTFGVRTILRMSWAELALQAGRLKLAEEVIDIQSRDEPGPDDEDEDDEYEGDVLQLLFDSMRLRLSLMRGWLVETEALADRIMARIAQIRADLADSGRQSPLYQAIVKGLNDDEQSGPDETGPRTDHALERLRDEEDEQRNLILIQLLVIEHDIVLAMSSVCHADNRQDDLKRHQRRYLNIRNEIRALTPPQEGEAAADAAKLADEELRIMQRAEQLAGRDDPDAVAEREQLAVDHVVWLHNALQVSENRLTFISGNIPVMLGLRLAQMIKSMMESGVRVSSHAEFDLDAVLDRTVATARTMGSILMETITLGVLAAKQLADGNLAAAQATFDEAVTIAVKNEFVSQLPYLYCQLVGLMHEKGDNERARQYYELAVSAATDGTTVHYQHLLKAAVQTIEHQPPDTIAGSSR